MWLTLVLDTDTCDDCTYEKCLGLKAYNSIVLNLWIHISKSDFSDGETWKVSQSDNY